MSSVLRRPRPLVVLTSALSGLLVISGCTQPTDPAGVSATTSSSTVGQVWQERLVVGPSNPEDLLLLESGNVLISGMSADPGSDSGASGSIYAMDPDPYEIAEVWPNADHGTAHDEERYADCPGEPELHVASPHGLGMETDEEGRTYLYVVNHGGREAVEVFEVETASQDVRLRWVGCSVLPEGTFGNGVVPDPLSDGFYVTHFLDPTNMTTEFERAFAGDPTGRVLHWTPAEDWSTVPNSEMSTPNGVAVSEDGTTLYVASWGGREIAKIDAKTGEQLASVDLEIMPDNLRLTSNGNLLITGQAIDSFETFSQYLSGERQPDGRYDVYELDPDAFAIEQIAHGEEDGFGSPTTALELPDGILLGSVSGTKLLELTRD